MIGCGMMGQEHLRNMALLPDGVVADCIFEPDDAMRKIALDIARQTNPDVSTADSLEQLCMSPDLDAIVITSPNFMHAAQLQAIADTRQKHGLPPLPILVEKPVAVNLTQVAALQKFAESYAAPVWTAMEYRYMPPIAALVAQTHAKTVTGEPVMLTVREHRYPFLNKVGDWNRFNANTGGTLVEKCCHFFDLMRLLMQDNPTRLFASAGINHNHLNENYVVKNNAGEGKVVKTPDIIDNAYVVLDFPRGRRAMLELCMFAEGSRYQEEIHVVGAAGKLECHVPGPTRFWSTFGLGAAPVAQLIASQRVWGVPAADITGPKTMEIAVDPALLAAGDHNGSTFYQHQKFADVVRGLANNLGRVEVSLQDGIAAVVIGLAAEYSAKTGQAVALDTGEYALK